MPATKRCPACNQQALSDLAECPACGIVFAKWRGHGTRNFEIRPPAPPVEAPRKSLGLGRIILSLVLIAAGRYGYRQYVEWDAGRMAMQEVEALAGQDEQAVRDRASERLNAAGENKPKAAASQFLGYYYKNTRAYGAYCLKQWQMDINAYQNAFHDAHQSEYARATAILAGAGFSEEQLWSTFEDAMRRAVILEMADAQKRGMAPMALCLELMKDGETAAANMRFSTVNPEAHAVLMKASVPAR